MSIEYFLKLLSRYFIVPLIGVLFGLGAAMSYALARGGYETSALVLVTPPAAVADRVSSHPERFVLTQEKIVTSDRIIAAAAEILGDTSAEVLESAITVQGGVLDDTMTITSSGDTEAESRDRVNAVAEAYTNASTKVNIETLRVEETTPTVSLAKVLTAGGVVGLMLGLGALLLIGFLRRPILGTSAWLEDERWGSVFPYLIKTKVAPDNPERPEVALAAWITEDGSGSAGAPLVLLQGIPSVSEATHLSEWLDQSAQNIRRRVAVGDDEQQDSLISSAGDPQSPVRAHPAHEQELAVSIWHPGQDPVRAVTPVTRVLVVKQGSSLSSLERAIKLSPQGQTNRIVIIS